MNLSGIGCIMHSGELAHQCRGRSDTDAIATASEGLSIAIRLLRLTVAHLVSISEYLGDRIEVQCRSARARSRH
jgi:hypothetical protein